ncbi:lytic murein transglycosylase [Vespertiliibacter pulmonis]|uniref:Soluble lytic murein transglycosylase n=1 Tax=Vespertiliibacter pulmonis TaxID=1443036 RepID=A0A3N4W9A2_9PAST|nr:transglycosylase SLT domain-containing protein [Vespertiliibacter pulmonis]QLB20145.1 lytic murein transglycosylase [Vespertiliibacter pulmonis]RPE86117.1 soluble lytic murein transglycosylase [Vespertiliibacter pulmonis]
MWKKTVFATLFIHTVVFAEETISNDVMQSSMNIEQAKQQWQLQQKLAYKTLLKQRENFLQLESLLAEAERQNKVTPDLLELAEQLYDPNYPLIAESDWAILKAKLASEAGKNPEKVKEWITTFSTKYPDIAKRNKLAQRLFPLYYEQQQFAALIDYAKQVTPDVNNQCRLFSAQFQLLAEQLEINPEVEQIEHSAQNIEQSEQMSDLLMQFDKFWLQNGKLSQECQNIEAYWRDKGFKTDEKVRAKAVRLFEKNAKADLEALIVNANPAMAEWLNGVKGLLLSVKELQNFAENQPLEPQNKAILLIAFPRFVKTLSEQTENANFSLYQQWAERWQLSNEEIKVWKTAFISRLFDNENPIFQLWRDEQIKQLKIDNLTERRLRMAIWQKTSLQEWLPLLSDESKAKPEWRYWQAKSDPKLEKKLLENLSQERGFYAMLAASRLNKPYLPKIPDIQPLSPSQKIQFKQPLERITELRTLSRFDSAKLVWISLLQAVSFEEKLALASYAVEQDWFDLAVEATIQAKAWDYLPLRLPNAYADWFMINLRNKPISQSFAMAIARQESAWNPKARSSANALGLMQMLPTTASLTAKNSQLPYHNERDLLAPFKNIMLGTAHLAELNQKYPNNRILISAAYNAGASRVEKWLARANGQLAMDEFIASIPFYETRGYVQNVLAYDYYYQMLYGNPSVLFYPEEQKPY